MVDKKKEDREITLGITDGKRTELKSGLNDGDTVVLEIKKDTKAQKNMFSGPQGGGGSRGGGR